MAQLVIFDCDGVLVDSEGISMRELTRALMAIGGMLDEEAVHATFSGRSLVDVERGVVAHLGRPVPDGWIDGWLTTREAAFEHELRPVPGALEALNGVRALGCEVCVASQGSFKKMAQTLRVTGLDAHVPNERIFSASMVTNGKPAPDLFLHAARTCGFEAVDCVVVEDSSTGVTAARAAGMRVFGYVAEPAPDDGARTGRLAALGAEVFHEMREVPGRVGA